MQARKLCDLLEQKREAFEGFLSATQSLEVVPDFQNNGKEIALLLNERRKYIKMIDRIDGRINTIRKESPSFMSRLSKEQKKRIARITALIGKVAVNAERINGECEATVTRWRDDFKGSIDALRRSQLSIRSNTRKAYREDQPKFLDITL